MWQRRLGVSWGRRCVLPQVELVTVELTHFSKVGYNIRFESMSTPDTKVLYLTDGMLFREILVDPLLSR